MIRELLREGLARDLEDEVFTAYREGRLSLSQAARKLGLDPWAWFDLLRRRNEPLPHILRGYQLIFWLAHRPGERRPFVYFAQSEIQLTSVRFQLEGYFFSSDSLILLGVVFCFWSAFSASSISN